MEVYSAVYLAFFFRKRAKWILVLLHKGLKYWVFESELLLTSLINQHTTKCFSCNILSMDLWSELFACLKWKPLVRTTFFLFSFKSHHIAFFSLGNLLFGEHGITVLGSFVFVFLALVSFIYKSTIESLHLVFPVHLISSVYGRSTLLKVVL